MNHNRNKFFNLGLIALVALMTACGAMGSISAPTAPAAPAAPSAGGGGATAADLDKFNSDATVAADFTHKAAWSLTKAVQSKDVVAKLEAERSAVMQIQDPVEKAAKLHAFSDNVLTQLNKLDFDAKAEELKKENNEKKNGQVNASMWNLGLGLLKDVALIQSSQKLFGGMPDPTVAMSLKQAENSVSMLKSQGSSLKTILSKSKSLMTVVKLDKLPTSASDAPMEVAD